MPTYSSSTYHCPLQKRQSLDTYYFPHLSSARAHPPLNEITQRSVARRQILNPYNYSSAPPPPFLPLAPCVVSYGRSCGGRHVWKPRFPHAWRPFFQLGSLFQPTSTVRVFLTPKGVIHLRWAATLCRSFRQRQSWNPYGLFLTPFYMCVTTTPN